MKSLIVDDDFFSRSIIQTMLAGCGECHVAVNGKEALAAFEKALADKFSYDVIYLDIMMPEMDGQEVLKRIRKIEHKNDISGRASVKIIMTTALDDSENIITALNEECEAYLIKPINKAKLKEILADFKLLI